MNPKLEIPEFESRNYARTEDYPDEYPSEDVVVLNPEEAHQQARVYSPDWTPGQPKAIEPARSRARELEANVLRESLSDAKQALEMAQGAVEVFNARRDTPERHKRLLVALKEFIGEIETERAVFDRQDRP